MMFGETNPPKKDPKDKEESLFLGFVSPAQRDFLMSLAWEHRYSIWIEIVGKDQLRATVFSKFPNKLKWVEWLLKRYQDNSKGLNTLYFMESVEHPVDGFKPNPGLSTQPVNLPPFGFGLGLRRWSDEGGFGPLL